MNLTLFLSTKRFNHKPTKEEKQSLTFQKQTVSVEELYKHSISGGAFSNLYDFDFPTNFSEEQTGDKHPKINHYIGSYTINIDLDHKTETMDECYNRVALKPTYCYTTSSNGLFNPDPEYNRIEYSYRFIYVFNELLYGKELYSKLFHSICSTQKLTYDKRAKSPYQNMFGNYNSESKFQGTIYSISDFSLDDSSEQNNNIQENKEEPKKVSKPIITTHTTNNNNGFDTFIEPGFYSDFISQDYNTIVSKYHNKYRNIQHSPLPNVSDDDMMIELPDDYYEIRRYFELKGKNKGRCKKVVYGQHRKKLLLFNLIIRRMITEDLTPTEMLYDLCYEMLYYIDNSNSEHFITKENLVSIVGSAADANVDDFRAGYQRYRERMVNHKYATKYCMTKREVANKSNSARHHQKKLDLWDRIGELYDCLLKDKENLQLLLDNGIEISLATLKRWKKENGLTKGRAKNTKKPSLDTPQQTFDDDVDTCSAEEMELKRKWYFTPHSRLDNIFEDASIASEKTCFIKFPDSMNQQSHSLLDGIEQMLQAI